MILNIFKLKEDKFYKKIVEQIKDYIISEIQENQLISLYLAGRILTKDRCPTSDIDIFGIVNDDFDIRLESTINQYFEQHPKFAGNKECRFRAIYLSNFEGKIKGNIIKSAQDIKLYLKLFRHSNYRLLYGKKINFSKFNIKDLSDRDELKIALQMIKGNIEYFKKNKFKECLPYHTIPNTAKWVLHIARLEVSIKGKSKYEPYFYKIEKIFRKEKNHIFHRALAIRKSDKNISRKEKKEFIIEVESYIKNIKFL